jgi:hypothetical protein
MIKLDWYDEGKHILYYDFPAEWTAEMLRQAFDRAVSLLAEVDHPVISILDVQETRGIPKNSLKVVSRNERRAPDHLIGAIMVTPNPIVNKVLQLWEKMPMMQTSFTSTKTFEDALTLAQVRLADAGI